MKAAPDTIVVNGLTQPTRGVFHNHVPDLPIDISEVKILTAEQHTVVATFNSLKGIERGGGADDPGLSPATVGQSREDQSRPWEGFEQIRGLTHSKLSNQVS